MSVRNIAVLGATGSIGKSTLDVISRHPDRFRAFALSAATKADEMHALCLAHQPRYAVMTDPAAAASLRARLADTACKTEVLDGARALEEVAAHAEVDAVMAAIVGAAGLPSSLAAARAGKTVLLANKEALVMAGQLFMDAVKASGAALLPIDSEHNAIFQSLPRNFADGLGVVGVEKIVLTASGGPFRTRPLSALADVTPDEACAHPNWVMGRKISVDSATMMNKGLEVIEAHWLFAAPPDAIDVVIHPQSVVHSMVRYIDGSVMAELGHPDMRTPIAYGLAYPERIAAGVSPLDLASIGRLDFEALDQKRFPAVGLAYAAMRQGGTASVVLNAANEIAVEAFLQRHIRFIDIAAVIDKTLDESVRNTVGIGGVPDLACVMAADDWARESARRAVTTYRGLAQ
jgi:1-deoxy-D-xylulose-5-phosphate reductoisomerase